MPLQQDVEGLALCNLPTYNGRDLWGPVREAVCCFCYYIHRDYYYEQLTFSNLLLISQLFFSCYLFIFLIF